MFVRNRIRVIATLATIVSATAVISPASADTLDPLPAFGPITAGSSPMTLGRPYWIRTEDPSVSRPTAQRPPNQPTSVVVVAGGTGGVVQDCNPPTSKPMADSKSNKLITGSIHDSPMSRITTVSRPAGGNVHTAETNNWPSRYNVARFYGTSGLTPNDPRQPYGRTSAQWTDRAQFMADQIANAGRGTTFSVPFFQPQHDSTIPSAWYDGSFGSRQR